MEFTSNSNNNNNVNGIMNDLFGSDSDSDSESEFISNVSIDVDTNINSATDSSITICNANLNLNSNTNNTAANSRIVVDTSADVVVEGVDIIASSSPSVISKPSSSSSSLSIVQTTQPHHQIGLFATKDLPPGTLILAEIPVLKWGQNVTFSSKEDIIVCIREVLSSTAATECVKHLYPRQLTDIDEEEIVELETFLAGSEDAIISILSEFGVERKELIRMILVLQHNGFESGLYRYLTILNHSCDPNCIKYSPLSSSFGASEIWTTRAVEEGEELTICYVEPSGQNPVSIRSYLWKNHRFACGCHRCRTPVDLSDLLQLPADMIATETADSSDIAVTGTSNIALALRRLNERMNDWQGLVDELETDLVSWQQQLIHHTSPTHAGSTQSLVAMPIRDSDIVGLHSVVLETLQLQSDVKKVCSYALAKIVAIGLYVRINILLRNLVDVLVRMLASFLEQQKIDGVSGFIAKKSDYIWALVTYIDLAHDRALLEWFGLWHPSLASAIIDAAIAANSLAEALRTDEDIIATVNGVMRGSTGDAVAFTAPKFLASRSALLDYAKSLDKVGEAIRKMYSTPRHFSECVRTMVSRRPGTVFWPRAVSADTLATVERVSVNDVVLWVDSWALPLRTAGSTVVDCSLENWVRSVTK